MSCLFILYSACLAGYEVPEGFTISGEATAKRSTSVPSKPANGDAKGNGNAKKGDPEGEGSEEPKTS